MAENTALAVQSDAAPSFVKASDRLSLALGIPVEQMISTLKAQCFRNSRPEDISNAQLAAFISIANDMKVNPLLPGMLYAYPDRGAIFPIMGPDGVYKKLSEHEGIDSWESEVFPVEFDKPPTHAVAKIYRKGVERPISYTAVFTEWFVSSNPNWKSRPRHMLGLRALKQCARQIIHGIPGDEDDRVIAGAINVTETVPDRPPPPPKAKRGAAAVKENPPEPVMETTATPVAEAPVAPIETASTPAPENKPPEAVKETPKPKHAAPTRHELKDGERIHAVCEIVEFIGKSLNVGGTMTPSVKASLRGEFEGEVYHLGGAKADGEKVVCPKEWQIERPVMIELLGVLNARSNKVIPQVQSIKEVAPESGDEF